MRAASLLDQVDDATRLAMIAAGRTSEVSAGTFVVLEGDPGTDVYLVLDGLVKVVKTSTDGDISFLALCRPGTIVGELAMLTGAERSSSLQAVEPSTLVRIGNETFERLLTDHPDLAHALLAEIAARIRASTLQIHDLANADAATRVAARLVELAEDIADDGDERIRLSLPISQEELADWAGLSRAGAVKALRSLRTDGLIETSRLSIAITDLGRLRAAAVV